MPVWWPLALVLAFVGSVLATDIARVVATRARIVDVPNAPRKIHAAPVPLLGGVGLFVGFALATTVVLVASHHFVTGEMTPWHIVGVLLGGFLLVLGGVLDDRYNLRPRVAFVFPLLAALVATVAGIGVEKVTNPFGGDPFVLAAGASAALTFVWLLCTTYTVKLLDGIDGLAGTVPFVAMLTMAALALSERFWQPDVALLALIGAAATLGFLAWNMYPARIFLGEGGSTFLGFLVGALAVISGGKLATALLVLGIPALDVAFVILRRLRRGQHPATGDSDHLHHLLLKRGYTQRQVVALYAVLALLFGSTTLLLTSWQKLIALAIVFVLALTLVWRLGSKPV